VARIDIGLAVVWRGHGGRWCAAWGGL